MNWAPGTGHRASAVVGGLFLGTSSSCPPAKSIEVGFNPLAATSVETGTPVRADTFASVSPGSTFTIAGFELGGGDGGPGRLSTCPMTIRLGLAMPLTYCSTLTVVPLRVATDVNVSPRRTV